VNGRRIVVVAPRGERGPLELPSSVVRPNEPGLISGGERSLYELATAAAVAGHDVELRGAVNGSILGELAAAAGAAPVVGLPARPPAPGEVVVIPEAIDRDLVATVHLSGATGVVYLLAPPGLHGWDFLSGWEPPDPGTVPLDSVGRPETFRAASALGFELWTQTLGIAAAATAAGVAISWLGKGTPIPMAEPGPKTHDVAIVRANRWYEPAAAIAGRLGDAVTVLEVGAVSNSYSLSAALSPARMLIFPSRIEGKSRISIEARAVGTVPVFLDTNPFATRADHGPGVVLVADLDQLESEVRRLLDAPGELARLAAEGRDGARSEMAWGPHVQRVHSAIEALGARPEAEGREQLGRDVRVQWQAAAGLLELARAERRGLEDRVRRLEGELAASKRGLEAYRNRPTVRLADRLARRGHGPRPQ